MQPNGNVSVFTCKISTSAQQHAAVLHTLNIFKWYKENKGTHVLVHLWFPSILHLILSLCKNRLCAHLLSSSLHQEVTASSLLTSFQTSAQTVKKSVLKVQTAECMQHVGGEAAARWG